MVSSTKNADLHVCLVWPVIVQEKEAKDAKKQGNSRTYGNTSHEVGGSENADGQLKIIDDRRLDGSNCRHVARKLKALLAGRYITDFYPGDLDIREAKRIQLSNRSSQNALQLA